MDPLNTIECDETTKTHDVRLRVIHTKDAPAPIHYHTVKGHTFNRITLAPSDEVDETGQTYRIPTKGTVVRLTEDQIEKMRETIASRWLDPLGSSFQVVTLKKGRKPMSRMTPLRRFLRIELLADPVWDPSKPKSPRGIDLLDAFPSPKVANAPK